MAAEQGKRIVFLCSGGGGNLAFLHFAIQQKWLSGAEIVGVLTDRVCPANSFANQAGLYNRVLHMQGGNQESLLFELENLRPDIIVTTVHKILGRAVVERFRDRLINLHYSLLPAFPGLIGTGPVKASLDSRLCFSGATVHLVSEEVDAGRPLVQAAIALRDNEDLESLMPVVFRCGCLALLRACADILGSGAGNSAAAIDVLSHVCVINGGASVPSDFIKDSKFWSDLQLSLQLQENS